MGPRGPPWPSTWSARETSRYVSPRIQTNNLKSLLDAFKDLTGNSKGRHTIRPCLLGAASGTQPCACHSLAPAAPAVQCFAVTSTQDRQEVVLQCLASGAADFWVKPLRLNEVRVLWTRLWHQVRFRTSGRRPAFPTFALLLPRAQHLWTVPLGRSPADNVVVVASSLPPTPAAEMSPAPCSPLAPARPSARRFPPSPWTTAAAATAPTRRQSRWPAAACSARRTRGGTMARPCAYAWPPTIPPPHNTHTRASLPTASLAALAVLCSVVEETEPTSKEGSAPDGRGTAHGEPSRATQHLLSRAALPECLVRTERTSAHSAAALRRPDGICLPAVQPQAAAAAWTAGTALLAPPGTAPATTKASPRPAATPVGAARTAGAAATVSLGIPALWVLVWCCGDIAGLGRALGCGPPSGAGGYPDRPASPVDSRAGNGNGSGNGNGTSAVGRFAVGKGSTLHASKGQLARLHFCACAVGSSARPLCPPPLVSSTCPDAWCRGRQRHCVRCKHWGAAPGAGCPAAAGTPPSPSLAPLTAPPPHLCGSRGWQRSAGSASRHAGGSWGIACGCDGSCRWRGACSAYRPARTAASFGGRAGLRTYPALSLPPVPLAAAAATAAI